MTVGDSGYQLQLSRIAYSFSGAIDMEYLQTASSARIKELNDHMGIIRKEVKESSGK